MHIDITRIKIESWPRKDMGDFEGAFDVTQCERMLGSILSEEKWDKLLSTSLKFIDDRKVRSA